MNCACGLQAPQTRCFLYLLVSACQCFSAGSAIHSIKIEAMLEAEFEHVLALAAEYDLTTMWNPVMRETVILHANLPFMTYFYGALWTPVVVIDVAVKAEGFDLGEVGAHCLAHLHPATRSLCSALYSSCFDHFFFDWAAIHPAPSGSVWLRTV